MLGLAAVLAFGVGAEAQVTLADTAVIDTVVVRTESRTIEWEDTTRLGSLFDAGLYGGLAYTTNWFEIQDEGYAVGFSPAFGAMATFWANPRFGVRLHTAYLPSQLPQAADASVRDDEEDIVVNNWFYDLDLVFRPWIGNAGFMGGTYFFLGAGGLTTNVGGEGPAVRFGFPCVGHNTAGVATGLYINRGVCLSYDPEYASVGQATAGVGFDVFPLASNIGIFGELGVHGYDSPAHTYGGNTGNATAEDKFAFTGRAVLGLKFMFGSHIRTTPMTRSETVELPPEVRRGQLVEVCVIENNQVRNIRATYRPTRGDTVVEVNGQVRRVREVFPDTGAAGTLSGQPWYQRGEAIMVDGIRYVPVGQSETLAPAQLQSRDPYQGIPVFTKTDDPETVGRRGRDTRWPKRIYLPLDQGCTYQSYAVLMATG